MKKRKSKIGIEDEINSRGVTYDPAKSTKMKDAQNTIGLLGV